MGRIKKYIVTTQNGSQYHLEDHTQEYNTPMWKIIVKNKEYWVAGLLLPNEREPLICDKITSIKVFLGYAIYFNEDFKPKATIDMPHTSKIVGYGEFK